MRFLCVSDIHGNARALDAVLAEGDARGFDQLVVCGDLCFPGPEPLAVWKTLVQRGALCVQGLTDRAVARVDPQKLSATTEAERQRIARLRAVHTELGELIVARLGKLQTVARLSLESGHAMVVVHGSPADPTEPISFDLTDEEIGALLGDDPGELVVCGGSHVPFERQLDGVRVVNVGSVGEAPGGEYAHATLVTSSPLGVLVEQFEVPLAPPEPGS
ncbi:MAG: metallophosphoesterase family protein [Sorangiineae bacterium]|nr:metallophosphoesterase family protein [Polyangiaceae bacterium]MEB2323556.1 metallophosphoesterase family protein [Sorangiineae bacterium]